MRKRCLNTIHELARRNKDVVFVGSDLGAGVLEDMKQELPGQFMMEGVSEQHIVGMAAGLAMSGKIVYINTIAPFITRRCFEQNVIDLGLAKANVRLTGSGGGLVYAPLGPTHLATDDIAIMRAIPNMTVIAPADAEEMERVVRASETYAGPIYIRIAKGGDPVVSSPDHPFAIGEAVVHRDAGEVLFVTTGIMLARSLAATESLRKSGIEAGVVHLHTIKPFDGETVLRALGGARVVITLEEHTIVGGLGSAVAELIAENIFIRTPLLQRLGIPDVFPDQYGSQDSLLKRFGLDVESIVRRTEESLARTAKR
ncbi:MAG: transketolase C-terminal domain-containing protein [Elusimicrobiota bacterium]